MISMYDLYKSLQATANPHQAGHIRPQENFQRWVNEIQEQLFEELARKMFVNRTISDKLSPFIVSVNVTLSSQGGETFDSFTRPDDYRYFSSARFITSRDAAATASGCKQLGIPTWVGKNGQRLYQDEDDIKLAEAAAPDEHGALIERHVQYIDNQKWSSVFGHFTKYPSRKRIYYTEVGDTCRVAPKGLGVIVLHYLRNPRPGVFAYTLGSEDQIVYDATNSVALEWDANMFSDFIARLQAKYGVYVKEDFTYQAGQLQRSQVKA